MEFADFVIDTDTACRLLGREPDVELQRWLAIGITGRALVRKTWVDDAEVGEKLFQELVRALPPEPSLDKPTKHRSIDAASRYAKLTRCRACHFWNGKIPCSACSGRGEIALPGQEPFSCSACAGAGKLVCPTCDGKRESYDVKVAYHDDLPVAFAHVFVPDEVAALRHSMVEFVKRQSHIPEVLTLDLAGEFAPRDAYRGRRGDHEHHGHRFGNALASARRYVERIVKSPSVMKSEYAAMAWPFACFAGQQTPGLALDAERNPGRV